MPELFTSVIGAGALTLKSYATCALCALLCGAIAAFAASWRARISKSFMISLLILPVIVQTVIMMVNGNVGTGIAVAGAFSLVRFRSVPGKAREIAAIFLAMTAGLSCAAGYVAIAVLFTLTVSVIMIAVGYIPLKSDREYELRITVPEALNYYGAFDEVFEEYAKSYRLVRVKTTNMGSLYKLYYKLDVKKPDCVKEMIDKLRCRNGNLEISVASVSEERGEEL